MAGWQTATRPDLTGPFTSTSNPESPAPGQGFESGYRKTIGNPGGPGLNVVRTILELFDTSPDAQAAVSVSVNGYGSVGYTQLVDPLALGLTADAVARSGSNVPTAPQFAQGTAKQGMIVVWAAGNLLVVEVVGGDSFTVREAAKWVQFITENLRPRS